MIAAVTTWPFPFASVTSTVTTIMAITSASSFSRRHWDDPPQAPIEARSTHEPLPTEPPCTP